jgi:hypothetical protein
MSAYLPITFWLYKRLGLLGSLVVIGSSLNRTYADHSTRRPARKDASPRAGRSPIWLASLTAPRGPRWLGSFRDFIGS